MARGERVRCLVRNPNTAQLLEGVGVELAQGDVTRPESLEAACRDMDSVIHAAGIISYWSRRRAELQEVNVEGTRNLLRAANSAGVQRFLLTSSIAAVGWVAGEGEGDEDTPFNWEGVGYCETKAEAESLALGWEGLETLAVSPGIILGQGDVNQNGGRVLLQLQQGQLAAAPRGSTTVANLDDVVAGHLAALDRGTPGQTYILGGTTLSFLDFFGKVAGVIGATAPQRTANAALLNTVALAQEAAAAFSGKEPRLTRQLVALSTRNRTYSSAKAREALGYTPRPLAEGIEACWRWYRDKGLMP